MAGQPERKVADFYKVRINDLASHKENCSPYLLSLGDLSGLADDCPDNTGNKKPGNSKRSLNANEDYALSSTQQQLLETFKKATRQINKAIAEAIMGIK